MDQDVREEYIYDTFFRDDAQSEDIVRNTIDKYFKGYEANIPELNKKMRRRCFEANSGFRENEYRVFIGKDLGAYADHRNLMELRDWDFETYDKNPGILKVSTYIPEHEVPFSMERRVKRRDSVSEDGPLFEYATTTAEKSVKAQGGDLVDTALGCVLVSAEEWLETELKLTYFDSAPLSEAAPISQTRLAVGYNGETYWGRSQCPGVDGAVEAAINAVNSLYILNHDPMHKPPELPSGPLYRVLGENGFSH